MLQTSRYVQKSRNLEKTILTEISQCTAVLYSDWSLQMGQMGPKMTLGTLKMIGDDFPGVQGFLRGSNRVHDLISDIYRQHSDTVYCSRRLPYFQPVTPSFQTSSFHTSSFTYFQLFLLLAFLHPARPTSSFPTSSLSYFKLSLYLAHPTSSFSYFQPENIQLFLLLAFPTSSFSHFEPFLFRPIPKKLNTFWSARPCNTMLYHVVPCIIMQYQAILGRTMQYCVRPYNTMQYHPAQCITKH